MVSGASSIRAGTSPGAGEGTPVAAIMGVDLLNHIAALLVTSEPDYAAAFGIESSEALVLRFGEVHAQGYLIGGIFFGLWLLPLG